MMKLLKKAAPLAVGVLAAVALWKVADETVLKPLRNKA